MRFVQDPDVRALLRPYRAFFDNFTRNFGEAFRVASLLPEQPGIYELAFLLDDGNRAVYIGQSRNVMKRVLTHLRHIWQCYYGHPPLLDPLRASIALLGKNVFARVRGTQSEGTEVVDILEPLFERRQYLRWFTDRNADRSKPPGWQTPTATVIAQRLGPHVQIKLLKKLGKATDDARLAHYEALCQRRVATQSDALPLWVADTSAAIISKPRVRTRREPGGGSDTISQ
jgi:hypothetical protein